MKAIMRDEWEMKNSGIDFIGTVPNEWEIRKVGSIATKLTDYVASGSFASLAENVLYKDEPDYAQLIRTVDLSSSINKKPVYVTKEAYEFLSNSNLFGGELILPNIGSVGCVYQYEPIYEHATLAPNAIMVNMDGSNRYYYYWFSNPVVSESMRLIGNSAVQVKFNKTQLRQYPIPVPSIDEQELIANYLDDRCSKIDTIIAEAKASIEEYKELKQAVIYEAVTKGVHGDKQYSKMQLKYLVSCNDETLSENTSNEYTFEYIEIGSVEYGKGIITTETVSFKDAPSRARRVVKDGDVIISTVRTYLKAIAEIHYNDTPQIASTGFAVLRAHSINNRYLYYAVLAEDFIQKIEANSVGISYPAITASKLISIKIPVPPKTEQEEIVSYLEPKIQYIDKLIDEKHTLIKDLESYKKSLIYEVVTGKRKVVE